MNNLKVFGLMLLAILSAMIGVYGVGRKAGKKATQLQQTNHMLKVIRKAKGVELAIGNTSDDDVINKLRDDWSR